MTGLMNYPNHALLIGTLVIDLVFVIVICHHDGDGSRFKKRPFFSYDTKKRAKGDPAALHLTGKGSRTSSARRRLQPAGGPRSPDAFYRGEEAGAAIKTLAREE